jgi:hypothetical protein
MRLLELVCSLQKSQELGIGICDGLVVDRVVAQCELLAMKFLLSARNGIRYD